MTSTSRTLLDEAIAHHRAGDLDQAASRYQKILRKHLDEPDALHLLGLIRFSERRFAEAAQLVSRATRADGSKPQFFASLAMALTEMGDFAGAASGLRRQVELDGTDKIAHYNLGGALFSNGELEQALASFRRAAEIDADFTLAHYNLGVTCQALQRDAEAEAAYRAALAVEPTHFDALANLVVVLRRQGRLPDAIRIGLRAVETRPQDADSWNNLGLVLRDAGNLQEAEDCIRKALSLSDRKAEYFISLGNVMLDVRRIDESLACFQKAVEIDPGSADAHTNLGLAWLLAGNFSQGWREYEWRLQRRDLSQLYPDFEQPRWNGEDPAGKRIFIYSEQGLGDTLQFCRYAPMLARLGAEVIVECQPPLLRLLAHSFPGISFVGQGEPAAEFDCWIPMMSLPGIFGSGPGKFPGQSSYLRPDPVGLRDFGELLGPRTMPRVGLVWSGDPRKHHLEANRIDRRRSMHFSTMASLAEVQGVEFFSIQKGSAAIQLSESAMVQPVRDLTGQLGDFADTAALVAQLDLLITVDTSMAHLAGGLGVPVWLLSRFDGCWRWLLEGTTTEWYPSMKIYRQQTAGDWQQVVEQLRNDLYLFAGSPAQATGYS